MKKAAAKSLPAVQSSAIGLLKEFKQLNVGDTTAKQERLVDQRFIVVATALLKSKKENDVLPWLLENCRCLDCMNIETPGSAKQLPRIDMINSEVSFRHLMEQVNPEVLDRY